MVCFISRIIILYSIYYIFGDKEYIRFLYVLLLFVVSMWFLIINSNLISLLLGWDGLGLTSYLLVIYYQRESSCNAGILTVLSNRIGDVAILISIGLRRGIGGWNYILWEEVNINKLIIILVILAGITKRAQIPFSAWLPAAIAAPTPVSALVHSSTLVTAGVFLLIRFNDFLLNRGLNIYLFYIGILTILISGWGANFEVDLKKVIALSTLRQLGVIIIILRLGIKELAFFHLITHALFKSTLFICAGFIIHRIRGRQDSRVRIGEFSGRPILCRIFRVINLSLCGFPFLAGFFSKDIILEKVFRGVRGRGLVLIVILRTGFTVSYSLRVIYVRIKKGNNLFLVRMLECFNSNLKFLVFWLFILRIRGGFLLGWRRNLFNKIFILSQIEKFYILIISLLAGLIIFYFIRLKLNINYLNYKNYFLKLGLSLIWYLFFLRTKKIRFFRLKRGARINVILDKGWREIIGGQGLNKVSIEKRSLIQINQIRVIVSLYLRLRVVRVFFIFMRL